MALWIASPKSLDLLRVLRLRFFMTLAQPPTELPTNRASNPVFALKPFAHNQKQQPQVHKVRVASMDGYWPYDSRMEIDDVPPGQAVDPEGLSAFSPYMPTFSAEEQMSSAKGAPDTTFAASYQVGPVLENSLPSLQIGSVVPPELYHGHTDLDLNTQPGFFEPVDNSGYGLNYSFPRRPD